MTVLVSHISTKSSVAVFGTGNIAGSYARAIRSSHMLELVGCFDVDPQRSHAFAAEHSCRVYDSIPELAQCRPDIVVNLSPAAFHHETSVSLLEYGLNVYSEKPLAMSGEQARDVLAVAAKNGVRVACAPSVWLGAAQQEIHRLIQSGLIGDVRLITADVYQGMLERWHPAPEPFFRLGPVADAAVYPLAQLSAIFGSIREVVATSYPVLLQRFRLDGMPFTSPTDDVWFMNGVFESGAVFRIDASYIGEPASHPRTMRFVGDLGTLELETWLFPGSRIRHAPLGEDYRVVRRRRANDIQWQRGVEDFAQAVRAGRPHLMSAERAAHLVDVFDAVRVSAEEGRPIMVPETFRLPQAV